MWAAVKAGCANFWHNAVTDKDGDFCPSTGIGLGTALIMLAQFLRHDSVDFTTLAQAQAVIIAAIGAKRWSENH